jgi:hypothetical protein
VTVLIVACVAAGTFVLSYTGVHALALQSGVSAKLARFYPAIFDAVLVIACAAAPLRARLWTRLYTWIVIVVVVGLLGTLDAVHAMNVTIPRRQAAGVAAVLPWVLLLLAFVLWLAILRHFRVERLAEDARQAGLVRPASDAAASPATIPDGMPSDAAPSDVSPADVTIPEATLDELFAEALADEELTGLGPGDPGAARDEVAAELPVEEIPGIPFSTGPRLRRVRSLPAPPVDDGDDEDE